ncbi:MAG: iron ABC transporter permease [Rhodocyclaceae bacterium]
MMPTDTLTPAATPRAPAGVLRLAPPTRRAPWLSALAIVVALLSLMPLGFVVWATMSAGWPQIVALLVRPRIFELLGNTLWLIVLTVPGCAALGVALAWLTERTTLPGRRVWSLLAAAPLAVPAFMHSYAWISVAPAMHGLGAATLVSVLAYFPFMYLPVAATLRRLDPALEDVAASLGAPPFRVFVGVVLPQLKLPVWGGALLIGLHLLAEYGLYAMLRFDTFTTAIFDQFQASYNGVAAHMLAGMLVISCLGLLTLEAVTRGRARYARIGAGSARTMAPTPLGPTGNVLCIALPLLTCLLALGVPLFTLGRWLYLGGLHVWQAPELWMALGQTVVWAGAGALVTTCAAIPMAWLSVRAPGRLSRVLEALNYVTGSLPGIVIALALVTITVRVALPLYQSAVTVLLAYLLLFLPRALISLRAGIAQTSPELENVARSLGRSPRRALWEITLRLAAPSMAAGAALVFLGITNELTATLLLAPNGTYTLATGFWAYTAEIDYVTAAPYAFIMMMLSLPVTWVLYQQSRQAAGR